MSKQSLYIIEGHADQGLKLTLNPDIGTWAFFAKTTSMICLKLVCVCQACQTLLPWDILEPKPYGVSRGEIWKQDVLCLDIKAQDNIKVGFRDKVFSLTVCQVELDILRIYEWETLV